MNDQPETPAAITFQTAAGRHLTTCDCGRPVGARVSGPKKDSRGQYRLVTRNACRGCGVSRVYVVRPRVMTPAEQAAFSAKRAEARKAAGA